MSMAPMAAQWPKLLPSTSISPPTRGTEYDKVIVAGREVARRPARDSAVRLYGAAVIEGGFDSSGGKA